MRDWEKKQKEYEERMARVKNAKLRTTCTICGAKAKLPCPCGTTQYCSVACQKVDWRERGHRTACKKIRDERAAEAARAKAPTRPPSPPKEVFYGPAPRSHADEVRARIAAEHEAARARREANPEPEPVSARFGRRCPICYENWDVNELYYMRPCCCLRVCESCHHKVGYKPCPLCRLPTPTSHAEYLAHIRRHVENDVPEAMCHLQCRRMGAYVASSGAYNPSRIHVGYLADCYVQGDHGLVISHKKAARIYKRAAELGDVEAKWNLACLYKNGEGVKMNKNKALQLSREAADRGHAVAQLNLGMEFALEETVAIEQDAFGYIWLAAKQGLTEAEYILGHTYCRAEVAAKEKSLEQGKAWLSRAAAKGHEEAQARLAELDA